MPTEMDLIVLEEIGSAAALLGAFAFIFSGLLAARVTQAKDAGISLTTIPTSSQATLKGAQLGLLGNAIILTTAALRIPQREKQLEAGTATGTLIPNRWILIGAIFAVIGSIAFTTGAAQRIAEDGQITIV